MQSGELPRRLTPIVGEQTILEITLAMSNIMSMSQTTTKLFNSSQPDILKLADTDTPAASAQSGKAGRKHFLLAGAAPVFVVTAGIAYWAGQLPVPSLIIAAGAGYLAYMTYLAVAFRHLIKDQVVEATQRSQQAIDNWLGAGVGGISPGSDDTAMHLEVGTLSTAHVWALDKEHAVLKR
jgi:hypothetical protein